MNKVRVQVAKKEAKKPKREKKIKESKPKKTAAAKSKQKGKGFFKSFIDFCKSPITHTLFGLFLFAFTIFLFFSFISFYQTHEADNAIFDSNIFSTIGSGEKANNSLGILGLYFSFLFIKNWFGAASFLLLILGVVYAFRLVFKRNLFNLFKTTLLIPYTVIYVSMVLALITDKQWIAGGMGFHFKNFLVEKMGHAGYVLLLLFLGAALFIFFGGLVLLKNKNKVKDKDKKIAEEEITYPPFIEEDKVKKPSFFVRLFTKKQKQIDEKIDNQVVAAKEIDAAEIPNSPIKEEESAEIYPSEDRIIMESIPGEDIFIEDIEPEPMDEEPLINPMENEENEEDTALDEILEDTFDEEEEATAYMNLEPYNPREDLSHFHFPEIDLLENYTNTTRTREEKEQETAKNKLRIKETLGHYGITIQSISAIEGPTVTLYEIVPAPGIRISRIKGLEDDIALSLAALGIRIIAPIPGRGTIGIEVPNAVPQIVSMKSVTMSEKFQNADNMALPVVIGKTISNEVYVFDLAKMPHVLMAGATGQGKSVGLNAILTSLLYKKHPAELKFVLVDPKRVELTNYAKIERHYLAKLPDVENAIITDTKKVVNTLNSLCTEMDRRYELLEKAKCRNLIEYNEKFKARRLNPEKGHRFLPYIVLVFDEFADCIMTAGREVETPIARLAQLARAIGIHLIIATQRPSVNVITGLIKANFPARIAFKVASKIDSRTILDSGGAENLIGKGDMLISTGSSTTRVQCAFVDTPETDRICDYIGEQHGYAQALMLPEVAEDPLDGGSQDADDKSFDSLFGEAARIVVNQKQGSASLLQRKLNIGYPKAGKIMDQLEREKIVGPSMGSKMREVLVTDMQVLENFLRERNLK